MNRKRNNSINENSNHNPKGSYVDNDISENKCYSNELLIHREHPSSTQVACCSSFQLCVLYIFTLWVPCCDVRYNFHIKTMFGSYLPPVVCRSPLIYIICVCLRIVVSNTLCALFCFSRHVYPILPVSLDCSIVIAPSLLSNVYLIENC